jgi:hypothetical protein
VDEGAAHLRYPDRPKWMKVDSIWAWRFTLQFTEALKSEVIFEAHQRTNCSNSIDIRTCMLVPKDGTRYLSTEKVKHVPGAKDGGLADQTRSAILAAWKTEFQVLVFLHQNV